MAIDPNEAENLLLAIVSWLIQRGRLPRWIFSFFKRIQIVLNTIEIWVLSCEICEWVKRFIDASVKFYNELNHWTLGRIIYFLHIENWTLPPCIAGILLIAAGAIVLTTRRRSVKKPKRKLPKILNNYSSPIRSTDSTKDVIKRVRQRMRKK